MSLKKRILYCLGVGLTTALFALGLFAALDTARGEELLTVFVCNYTSKPLVVEITRAQEVGKEQVPYSAHLQLEPVGSMGKGNYQYHPPNVAKLKMPPGAYFLAWRHTDTPVWNTQLVSITKNLMSLDFEED